MSYFGIPIRNGLPIGLGSVAPLASGGGSPFSPLSLFAGGAPGAWYDPSDYGATGTLFQDSAGTTPVTAVEQPVGLMLDKSQGLVLGPELVTNGDFSNGSTGWTQISGTFTFSSGRAIAANSDSIKRLSSTASSMVAGRWYVITWNQYAGAGTGAANWTIPGVWSGTDNFANGGNYVNGEGLKTLYYLAPVSGQFYFYNFEQAVEYDNISVKELAGNHAFQATSASRPVLSARVNKLLATAALATQSVTTRATAHTLRFEGAGSVTLTGTAIGVYTAGTHSITTTAGTLTLTVLGSVTSADLRETNDGVGVPAYQAVVTSTDYATTGFLPYLKFDGVDDSLSTNSISFTATDKMSVFAGVRKLSDAAVGMVAELSSDASLTNGSFNVNTSFTGSIVGPNYGLQTKGTTAFVGAYASGYSAPITNTVTGIGNISGDRLTLRVNGTQVAQSTGDQGTGNYGNHSLFIGRRNNASLPFNGQMYSMIIVGKAVTAGELSSTETYVNQKTGAY